jgi:hypothetical protein
MINCITYYYFFRFRECQLLPRRYHAWFSINGEPSGIEDDDVIFLSLCYTNLPERYKKNICICIYLLLLYLLNISNEMEAAGIAVTNQTTMVSHKVQFLNINGMILVVTHN